MKKLLEWYYGKASIRRKLVISYLILVLLPLVVLGSYSYHIARKNLLIQTKDTMKSNVDSIAYNMQTNVSREEDNLKYLSYNSSFRERLEKGSENTPALAQELNRSVEPVFWYFITSDRNIKGIEIYSPCISQELGSFLKTEKECENQAWYDYHQTNYQSLWTLEDGALYATRPLLDAATSSKPIGVMKLEVYANRFTDAIYQSQFKENGVLLVNENGEQIAGRALEDTELEAEIRNVLQKRWQSEAATQEKIRFLETGRYLLCGGELLDNGWQLFYYVDKKEIAEDMNGILQTTLLLIGICLLIITVLISVLSKILSSRILNLKHCAEKVGRGEFEIVTETGYTDEIGVVAHSFDVMSKKIDEMMNQVYQMGLEKRATELKALQAMINPHFLYNCLSSIKWKAIRANEDSIADITGLLAKFYRTTLNGGKQITTVYNELENVRAYLEIQSRTHEDGFEIEYQIPQEGMDYEMPNFLLQPIVENAICHGIDCCEEGQRGMIRVEYVPGAEFLEFHIYNNGPMMEEAQLQKILEEPGKGYGIYNIQERIRMYYDRECGIFTRISEDGLVCFTVKIRSGISSGIGLERL
ncbi:MAG: histidine kinase [Lachnospiraceae bacterium]|nr:histidine kinase [Lachnospiraceae bacterium]